MKEELITFETAKLAKEKGFNNLESLTYFYTKPNSKMFGIDEEGRSYPIKNTSKKLYKCGEHAALRIESIIEAPTQSLLQKWLRDVYKIEVTCYKEDNNKYSVSRGKFTSTENTLSGTTGNINYFDSYEEALEVGLLDALKLIK